MHSQPGEHPIPPRPLGARCSEQSADEPLAGTASHQRRWVLLEHPGAWSRDILDGNVFGAELTAALQEHLERADARLLLIRHPGRAGQHDGARRVYLVDTAPGQRDMLTLEVSGPADLLAIDLHDGTPVGGADPDATLRRVDGPLALVCTHGKRDQCCAVWGRPVADALDKRLGAELAGIDPAAGVWECSHTGGHRFAPVLITMPGGLTYGSDDVDSYVAAVRAAREGRISLTGLRGQSAFSPVEQVADIAVRSATGDVDLDALFVVGSTDPADPERARADVRHTDGRHWHVEMQRRALPERPASCGAAPKKAGTWDVLFVEERNPRVG